MDEKGFDAAIGLAVRQAVNSGIEPVVVLGIVEAHKLDVYHHMKKAQAVGQKQANGAPSILTPEQIESLRQKRGGN